jgi:cytochrome c'
MRRLIVLSGMCLLLGGTALLYIKPYFVLRMQRATALSCGDLMVAILQPRHTKLGLAGQAGNWRYLAYELVEFQEAIDRIDRLSPWVAEQMQAFTSEPMAKLTKAVEAQDPAGFTQAYGQLTQACNQCHQHFGREEVAIRVPDASPFPNQDFSTDERVSSLR